MAIEITLFITLIAYSFIVSQSFMYILALKDVQLQLDGPAYLQFRKLTDAAMRASFKFPVYLALAGTIALWLLTVKQPGSFIFIAASIALPGMIAEILLALKGNIPINNIINGWSPENLPANWGEFRLKWLNIFQYRQLANTSSFISLLAAAVFGSR